MFFQRKMKIMLFRVYFIATVLKNLRQGCYNAAHNKKCGTKPIKSTNAAVAVKKRRS